MLAIKVNRSLTDTRNDTDSTRLLYLAQVVTPETVPNAFQGGINYLEFLW
jgi:hypothetical protein